MTTNPLVAGVVLNWNSYDDTVDCLDGLESLNYPNLDIIVVDNGSTDGSGNRIDEEFEDVTVIHKDENVGFARGMNEGILKAQERSAEYVWILNNDLVFEDKQVLSELLSVIEENNNIGILSPLITYYPETEDVWFTEGVTDRRTGHTWHETYNPKDSSLIYNDYIPLCAALIPMNVIENCGLLPSGYFLYYEDVEYSYHLQKSGYDLVTVPYVRINHKESKSSGGKHSPIFSYYRTRGQFLYLHRIDASLPKFIYAIAQRGLSLLKNAKNFSFKSFIAYIRGIVDGLLGNTGYGPY